MITSGLRGTIFNLHLEEDLTAADVVRVHSNALNGKWCPKDCRAKFRLAVMVPLRGRGTHNYTFLMNMHTYFQMHKYDYGIFFIEQTSMSRFNRGMLLNVGFLEINKRWPNVYDCFALHDVDIYPMNTTISYECPPDVALAHLGNANRKFDFKMPYADYAGGLTVVNTQTYLKVNGFSNVYFGWGAEDDDFCARLGAMNGKVIRYSPERTITYMIDHKGRDDSHYHESVTLLGQAKKRFNTDGIRNMPPYKVKKVSAKNCATVITVELDQNIVGKEIAKRMDMDSLL